MAEVINRETLCNTRLWVRLDARGMERITELQLATIIYQTLNEEYKDNPVSPDEILGTQYLQPQRCWIIYMANEQSKVKLLALSTLTINNKQHDLVDFNQVGVTKPTTRISIHGIPLHVPDSEIEQWLDQYIIPDTPVQLAYVKNPGNTFKQLLSGNRFCYAKQIITPIPRFVKYMIPDPLQIDLPNPELMEINVVIYHSDQPINCKHCHNLMHTFPDCPKRKLTAKTEERERRCYRCSHTGHVAVNCPMALEKTLVETNRTESVESEEDDFQSLQDVLEATVIHEEIQQPQNEDMNQYKAKKIKEHTPRSNSQIKQHKKKTPEPVSKPVITEALTGNRFKRQATSPPSAEKQNKSRSTQITSYMRKEKH